MLFLFCLLCLVAASAVNVQSDPISHVYVTNITILQESTTNNRHAEEKSQLEQRLQKTGTWSPSHSRYRLLSALHGFYRYKQINTVEVNKWRDWYKHVPKRQRKMVESVVQYTRKLNTVEHLFESNEIIANAILQEGLQFYGIKMEELQQFITQVEKEGKTADRTSVNQAMKHFVRDWAEEGRDERMASFPCILDAISSMRENETTKVLLPGAGLGRLAHEIDHLGGFEVTMNEYSSYMNLAYRYLDTIQTNSASYHPYIDWWSHHATTADLQRPITFPDKSLSQSVLLVEGDFTTVFNIQKYDVIVTLFFIDTARNLIAYLETIHRLLRPGGKWINLGPLLYGSAPFLQLSLDEIVAVSEDIGFKFLNTDDKCGNITVDGLKVRGLQVPYGTNARGLSRNAYQAQFWIASRIK
ncbi:hypothetical protein ASPWEDRAFT_165833 [Aspergillus wentii DTO 134E9]|uniref:Uncharacterized protein n=1 Tax=Aspergillus wentii DTO 134E9 TaxID=1073089 RepID=A0A1L9R508_ASPWE|nr:uncharacterized protein ASPWEDRAFT_165833 [Aspergillus wentii DTO 134E9]KAI9927271.1 hypothetical protein MW887_003658 [Aspergillus wentii]OJJ30001.1 hypothetical protein ASPWEDRAFT_165833 [Aspergillus wentii DTO 134E9]